MRYAIFTDIHANLEALEAVLAKIDEIAQQEPIDQVWFLGDLVGYGPNPNECIVALRARTNVIIAGNHDWAAVGKIDLDDFSAAARISAEWTAKQLTEEHRAFLTDLPERLDIDACTLVHGSPYGPLWEYLTSETLAERSFRYFDSRYCFVGHTHVPVIFQQSTSADYDEAIANTPTLPLAAITPSLSNGAEHSAEDQADEKANQTVGVMAASASPMKAAESAFTEQGNTEEEANTGTEPTMSSSAQPLATTEAVDSPMTEDSTQDDEESVTSEDTATLEENEDSETEEPSHDAEPSDEPKEERADMDEHSAETSSEAVILNAEEQTNSEIEELLALLGLTQSMVQVTNEMFTPPEGHWQAPEGYRFIINPGGVGQPRDGDPRAAFMIYDTERGFEFHRVPYALEKTQEKIIEAGLPHYLAMRLSYGR